MNKKGFTLIELLVTITIISLISILLINSSIKLFTKYKANTEEIYISKLKDAIDSYITLTIPKQKVGPSYNFIKCSNKDCTLKYEKTITKVLDEQDKIITLEDLIKENIISKSDLAKNKCFNNYYPEIKIYKDSDSIYYYYLNLKENNNTCSQTTYIITNLPEDLQKKVGLSWKK